MESNGASHRPLLTVSETADRLRVSEKTARRLLDRGPGLRVGGQIIDEHELESWLFRDVGGSSSPPSATPAERRVPVEPAVEAQALAGGDESR
jgi:hypothetical protein